jgi:hypothetical protein
MKECCETRRQLAEQFAIAARVYAEVAVAFGSTDLSRDDYIRLSGSALEAQARAHTAFAAFEKHVQLHGCCEAADRPKMGSPKLMIGVTPGFGRLNGS